MKKLTVVILMTLLFASPVLAEDQNQNLTDISRIIDAKVVFALAEGSERFCPNLMFGSQELVKRHIRGIVSEDGEISREWFMSISRQSNALNKDIRSIVGLPPREGVAKIEIHYDSGVTRVISISREGEIVCGNGSELLKK